MTTVRFRGFGDAEVPVGTRILDAAAAIEAPEGSDCGGCCSCSTCHVYVVAGAELLSPREDDEEATLELAPDVRTNSRLGCQAKVAGEGVIEIEITPWSRDAYLIAHPEKRMK
jgi:2Fe-2S ferredoxin